MTVAAVPGASRSSKATLLFVDDEQRVLTSMRAMFRRDYRVFIASSGAEALDLLERERVDVVVSDQRMPEMTGVEVLAEIKRRHPDAMRILLTGYADLEAVEASINEAEVFRYLVKPCEPDELRGAVALAVDAARSVASAPRPAAELIPFPGRRRNAASLDAGAAAASQPAPGAVAAPPGDVEVLLLSRDRVLRAEVAKALDGVLPVRQAASPEAALSLLAEHPVGVLVTDMAVADREIEDLTKALKQQVPELVTIVASDRADAQALIGLINDGQIYRFLLKPVSRGQCRLWLESAARKYQELCASPEAVTRHCVAARTASRGAGMVRLLRETVARVRERLGSSA